MKNLLRYSLVAVLAVLLASCVTTKTTSFSDPAYNGKTFNAICVFADLNDFEAREKLETKIVEELKNSGVNAIKSTEVLPPTRVWTEEELKNKLVTDNIDGFLKIKIAKAEIVEKSGKTTNTYVAIGEDALPADQIKMITNSINKNKSFLSNFQSELVDIKSNKLAWNANTITKSGEAFNNTSNVIINNLAQDIAKELKEKGHLKQLSLNQ